MARTRTFWAATALAAAAIGATAVPAAAAPAAAPRAAAACATGWGSLYKADSSATYQGSVTNVRTGQHDCYDRFVIDVPGAASGQLGYSVGYVDELVADGSGNTIPVSGGAILDIRVTAPVYDPDTGAVTYPGKPGRTLPGVDLTGYRTFRDARFAVSFEGQTQFGLGVRARLPFRVLQLDGRLVVDVAHTW